MADLKDKLLARRPKTAPLKVEGWEGFHVRQIPAGARKEVNKMTDAEDGLERLIQLAVVYPNGEPVFGEDDLEAIGKLAFSELNDVVGAFNDLNGYSEEGQKAAGKDSSQTVTAISRSA